MAVITKVGKPSFSSLLPSTEHYHNEGMIAGEALASGDLVYIKSSDGKVYRTVGGDGLASDRVRGMVQKDYKAGKEVTIFEGPLNIGYASGMTPGTDLFASATAGALQDSAVYAGQPPAAFVLDAQRIRLLANK